MRMILSLYLLYIALFGTVKSFLQNMVKRVKLSPQKKRFHFLFHLAFILAFLYNIGEAIF